MTVREPRRSTEVVIEQLDRPRGYVVRVGGRDQSYVDLDDPTYLAFDYVRRMGDVVDAVAEVGRPVRIVHVGGAGLTLPRYVAATRPRSSQIVLEPDDELTARVRVELPLPRGSGIKVRSVDGLTGVAALRDASADLLVVDAFDEGQVPAELIGDDHLQDVARVLGSTGWYLLNVADAAPFPLTRAAVTALRSSHSHVVVSAEPATLRGRRAGNLLVVASGTGAAGIALMARATTSSAPYRVLVGRDVRDRFG